MATHVHRQTVQCGSDADVGGPVTVTADGECRFDGTIEDGAATVEIDIAATVANIKSVFIMATRAVNLFTNSNNGAGGQTIALGANSPYTWYTGCGRTNPLTPDITKFYAAQDSVDYTLTIRLLVDVTP